MIGAVESRSANPANNEREAPYFRCKSPPGGSLDSEHCGEEGRALVRRPTSAFILAMLRKRRQGSEGRRPKLIKIFLGEG